MFSAVGSAALQAQLSSGSLPDAATAGQAASPADFGYGLYGDCYGKALGLDIKQQTLESEAQTDLVQPPGSGPGDVLLLKPTDISANLRTLALSGTPLAENQLFDSSLMPALGSV